MVQALFALSINIYKNKINDNNEYIDKRYWALCIILDKFF